MPLWRFLVLILLAVAGVAVLAIWVFPVTQDFHSENPFWNGLEAFRKQYNVTSISSAAELPVDARKTVLVVIPCREPTEAGVDGLKSYLKRGGTLVLADDYAFGNVVLERMDLPYRFSGAPLLDPLFNYRNEWFPLAIEVSPSPLTAGVSSLALNYGTALEDGGLVVVVRSSAFSYLDLNYDGTRDPEERVGSFPVVGHTAVAGGRLILIGDPSILINSMERAKDNALFVSNLVESAGPDASIFLDQSLLPPSSLTQAKGELVFLRTVARRPEVLVALTATLAVALLYPVWRKRGGHP